MSLAINKETCMCVKLERNTAKATVNKCVDPIVLGHVFKVKNGLAPNYMGQHFIPQASIHSYRIRSTQKGEVAVPKVKGVGSKSFCYTGCSLWNNLPSSITQIYKLSVFKPSLKNHLLENL